MSGLYQEHTISLYNKKLLKEPEKLTLKRFLIKNLMKNLLEYQGLSLPNLVLVRLTKNPINGSVTASHPLPENKITETCLGLIFC